MGVGTLTDLIQGVARGIDLFDCVLPTRVARHGAALTHSGQINLRNAQYIADPAPLEENCLCYACQHFSRAYLRHLVMSREILAYMLLSVHNLHMLISVTREMRTAIVEGRFASYAGETMAQLAAQSGM
jgi:queuine tRNA-ribosyltransferase